MVTNPVTAGEIRKISMESSTDSFSPFGKFGGLDIISLSIMSERECLGFEDRNKAYEFAGYAEAMTKKGWDINRIISAWTIKESHDIFKLTDKVYSMERIKK